MTKNIQEICDLFKDFMDGCRVQMLIDRSVGNSNKGSARWVNKLISHDEESFIKNVSALLAQQLFLNDTNIRLYSSMNRRHASAAIQAFKIAQVHADALNSEDKQQWYFNVKNNFVSCLCKPEFKIKEYLLLDLDCHDYQSLEYLLCANNIPIVLKYPTVRGIHYVISRYIVREFPVDTRIFECIENLEVKNDGLLLLNTI